MSKSNNQNQESDLVIVCPSKGRAKNVLTTKLVPSVVLVVPESEREEYEKHNPNQKIVGTPKHVKGITATRQWIIENYENVLMLDDDIERLKSNFYFGKDDVMTIDNPDEVLDIINRTYDIAKQIGAKMFAFSKIRNPLEFNTFEPFSHTGYMNGSFSGFLKGHELSYDLTMNEGEDHYISCLCIYKHRYCLIDNRYSFVTKDNFTGIGGCNSYRTLSDMEKNTLELAKKFGSVVKLKKPTNNKKSVNAGERTISFPF